MFFMLINFVQCKTASLFLKQHRTVQAGTMTLSLTTVDECLSQGKFKLSLGQSKHQMYLKIFYKVLIYYNSAAL